MKQGFYCYECKFCHHDVFGRALCLAKGDMVISDYTQACDDYGDPYETNDDGMVLLSKL